MRHFFAFDGGSCRFCAIWGVFCRARPLARVLHLESGKNKTEATMSDFNNDAEKVLAKAQSLRDRCSHSYLGAAHLAVGLVEGPDATLKT